MCMGKPYASALPQVLFKKKNLFIWLYWVIIAACGVFHCCPPTSPWFGMHAQQLGSTELVVGTQGLRCPAACGILVLQPWIKAMSLTLEGRFLTSQLLGRSPQVFIKMYISVLHLRLMNQNFSKENLEVLIFNRPEDEKEPVLRRRKENFLGTMNKRNSSSNTGNL